MSTAEDDRVPEPPVDLIEPARQQVLQIAADLLGKLKPDEIPPALRPIAKFTPTRRRQRGAVAIASAIDSDETFRGRVAELVEQTLPTLVETLRSGGATEASEPADVAAVAYLIRPDGWREVVARAGDRWRAGRVAPVEADAEHERLRGELTEAKARLKALSVQARDERVSAVAAARDEAAEVRRTLRERTAALRAAEKERDVLRAQLAGEKERAASAGSTHRAELRRLAGRISELERTARTEQRVARADREHDEARLWLLLETLGGAASGLRRELGLPDPGVRPAELLVPSTGPAGVRTVDDRAALDRLLDMPATHLIVDGYNVTMAGYGELSLEEQRSRLIASLSAIVGRSGLEVTIAFDGRTRPVVQPRVPRGVRVLFSGGQIADDLIRQLVAAEPPGRVLAVVTSDQQIVTDVRRAGAWTVPSRVLLERLRA